MYWGKIEPNWANFYEIGQIFMKLDKFSLLLMAQYRQDNSVISHSSTSFVVVVVTAAVTVAVVVVVVTVKYHCTPGLRFYWFEFIQTSKSVDNFNTGNKAAES